MCISIEPTANRRSLSVQVTSAFQLEDAQQIGAAISRAAPGTRIEIDFREARRCDGPALARLAEAMRSGRAHIALQGLAGHDRKLLGYLGGFEESPEAARAPQH